MQLRHSSFPLSEGPEAGSTGIATQIMLAGIYLGPAVMWYFVISWMWGDETKATGNDDAGNNG